MAKKTAEATEELQKTGETAVAEYEYGDDQGRGFEHQTKADTSIPILAVLQSGSPQAKDGRGRAGDFFNTVTEQVWKREQGILFIPATTRHVFVEWVPRNQGGGYRGQHAPDSETVALAIKNAAQNSAKWGKNRQNPKFGEYFTEEGNQLVETFYVYGATATEDGAADSMAIFPFSSTKIRPYKGWMTRLRQTVVVDSKGRRQRPPLYAHLTRLTSYEDKNSEGEFFVPSITSGDPRGIVQSLLRPDDERFIMAKACMMLVDSGEAKVDYSQGQDGGEDGEKPPF